MPLKEKSGAEKIKKKEAVQETGVSSEPVNKKYLSYIGVFLLVAILAWYANPFELTGNLGFETIQLTGVTQQDSPAARITPPHTVQAGSACTSDIDCVYENICKNNICIRTDWNFNNLDGWKFAGDTFTNELTFSHTMRLRSNIAGKGTAESALFLIRSPSIWLTIVGFGGTNKKDVYLSLIVDNAPVITLYPAPASPGGSYSAGIDLTNFVGKEAKILITDNSPEGEIYVDDILRTSVTEGVKPNPEGGRCIIDRECQSGYCVERNCAKRAIVSSAISVGSTGTEKTGTDIDLKPSLVGSTDAVQVGKIGIVSSQTSPASSLETKSLSVFPVSSSTSISPTSSSSEPVSSINVKPASAPSVISCKTSVECDTSSVCVNSRCITSARLIEGSACKVNANCLSGICDSAKKLCVKSNVLAPAPTASCASDADCSSNRICVNSKCIGYGGFICNDNTDCFSNNCVQAANFKNCEFSQCVNNLCRKENEYYCRTESNLCGLKLDDEAACTNNVQCKSSLCINSRCVVAAGTPCNDNPAICGAFMHCSGDAGAKVCLRGIGVSCDSDSQCTDNSVCVAKGTNEKRCYGDINSPCNSDAVCALDLKCENNKCVSPILSVAQTGALAEALVYGDPFIPDKELFNYAIANKDKAYSFIDSCSGAECKLARYSCSQNYINEQITSCDSCSNGVCNTLKKAGEVCTASSKCEQYSNCVADSSGALRCLKGNGAACESASQCVPNMVCGKKTETDLSRCHGAEGAACASNTECANDFECKERKCAAITAVQSAQPAGACAAGDAQLVICPDGREIQKSCVAGQWEDIAQLCAAAVQSAVQDESAACPYDTHEFGGNCDKCVTLAEAFNHVKAWKENKLPLQAAFNAVIKWKARENCPTS